MNEWLIKYSQTAYRDGDLRRKSMNGFRVLIKTIIGFLIKPRILEKENLYIFEGIRNKEYMAYFSPSSVVVVGSYVEKAFAKKNGYGFCWSFPMVCAIHSNHARSWKIPVARQLKLWINELSRFKRIVIFNYEDTQALGCFFVNLSRMLKPACTSVCIQHGYFMRSESEIRLDGKLSDISFVWDEIQGELINNIRASTFVVGLPYEASAKASNELQVILVGTGIKTVFTDKYERTMKCYMEINKIFTSAGMKVLYRPHPNEFNDKNHIDELNKRFVLIADINKFNQLNGPRSIFIGTESSLLYEAGVAGHYVARLDIESKAGTLIKSDFNFSDNQISILLTWALDLKNKKSRPSATNISQLLPLERFASALRQSKLID